MCHRSIGSKAISGVRVGYEKVKRRLAPGLGPSLQSIHLADDVKPIQAAEVQAAIGRWQGRGARQV